MRRLAVLVPVLFAAAPSADAQTGPGFEFGASVQLHRDRTRDEALVRGAGTFVAIHLGYTETLGRGWFLRAVADGGSGDVAFAGEGVATPGIGSSVVELQLHAGRDLSVGRATLTPFTGLLSRVADTEGQGRRASDGTPLYRRSLRSVFVPVGATLSVPGGRARVELSAQANIFVGGEARSRFSDADPALPNVRLDIRGGHGLAAGAAIVMPWGRRTFSVGPFWRRTVTARSEAVNVSFGGQPATLFEPRTTQTETGLRGLIRF